MFAASDQMAFGVYEAVRRRGLRVPEDVSVVGFDDLPESRWASPPLTTVRQPLVQMGLVAARTVLRMSRGEQIETRRGSSWPPNWSRATARRRFRNTDTFGNASGVFERGGSFETLTAADAGATLTSA